VGQIVSEPSLDFLDADCALHLGTKAQRRYEFTLRNGVDQNRDLSASLTPHLNGLNSDWIDDAILGTRAVNHQQ
jgi:hypothetical protein